MRNPLFNLVSALLLASSMTACAALTPSQVGEVKKFAQASEEYSTLPGSLATSYGVLLRDNKLLSLCRYRYGADTGAAVDTSKSSKAWEEIQGAYALERDFDAAGKRMDAALGVLKEYSDLLTLLVSDKSNEDLEKSATKLGKAVDAATDAYNVRYRSLNPLRKMGGDLGLAARGAGGIYIRNRQAAILKETVYRADPLIQSLMMDIEYIALNRFKPDFINYEKNYLGPAFQSVANNRHQVDVTLASTVYEDLARARAGALLSGEVASAASAYAKAHSALVEKTRSRRDLKQAIEEIKVLSEEIKAAKKTKNSIK